MNCTLFFQLKQRIYIAEIKQERHEAMRLEYELDEHLVKCPFCNGLNYEPLASDLFGFSTFVTLDRKQDKGLQ